MNTTRKALIASLHQLSALYPSMRCGQILEMAGTLAGAHTVADLQRATDAEVLHEAVRHYTERLNQLGLAEVSLESVGSERIHLISTIRDTPFLGHNPLICELIRVANEMNTTLYDIEDDALLQRLKPQDAVA
jgi:hypothetical protein